LVEATAIELAIQRWWGCTIKGCCYVDGEEKCDGKALLELGSEYLTKFAVRVGLMDRSFSGSPGF